jgi:hypothetical protein
VNENICPVMGAAVPYYGHGITKEAFYVKDIATVMTTELLVD